MGSVIPVFAAIFMILGSIGALFSAFFGVFLVSGILLVFSAVFFIVFSVSGKKSKTVVRQAFKDELPAEQTAYRQEAYRQRPAWKQDVPVQPPYRPEVPAAGSTSTTQAAPTFTEVKQQAPQKTDGGKEATSRSLFSKKNAEPLPAFKQDLPAAKEEKYMRYCKSCGFIGSQLSTEEVPPCPKCGSPLSSTTTTLDQFTAMSIERRKATVKSWMSV